MSSNKIVVEEITSNNPCNICDFNKAKFMFYIYDINNDSKRMECLLCDDCFSEFIEFCYSIMGDETEDGQSSSKRKS